MRPEQRREIVERFEKATLPLCESASTHATRGGPSTSQEEEYLSDNGEDRVNMIAALFTSVLRTRALPVFHWSLSMVSGQKQTSCCQLQTRLPVLQGTIIKHAWCFRTLRQPLTLFRVNQVDSTCVTVAVSSGCQVRYAPMFLLLQRIMETLPRSCHGTLAMLRIPTSVHYQ